MNDDKKVLNTEYRGDYQVVKLYVAFPAHNKAVSDVVMEEIRKANGNILKKTLTSRTKIVTEEFTRWF